MAPQGASHGPRQQGLHEGSEDETTEPSEVTLVENPTGSQSSIERAPDLAPPSKLGKEAGIPVQNLIATVPGQHDIDAVSAGHTAERCRRRKHRRRSWHRIDDHELVHESCGIARNNSMSAKIEVALEGAKMRSVIVPRGRRGFIREGHRRGRDLATVRE
jgi:hypothetical protein